MILDHGTKLGPYEILEPLGAGGMGEVYKARDTRLDRLVAIKVAAVEFSERFGREAHAIAQLNHPHICQLYDVGPNYLVMEHIEGARLTGPLPIEEALRLAAQIAEALDAAHRKGIMHRDLKPGNVLVTKSGVKLLDFGLAKMQTPAASEETVTKALTGEGTIVGTLQYMSPEQLQGKEVDSRTDIFAFGLVLYEMLTGKRAFAASSQASLIGAILHTEPPQVSSLAPMTPPALDRLIRRCLAKDPDERWQSARDIASELRWIAEGGSQGGVPAPVMAHRRNRERLGWMVAAVLGAAALAASAIAILHLREAPPAQQAVRFRLDPPEGIEFAPYAVPAISPDGGKIVVSAGAEARNQLWMRSLASPALRPLPGTEGATWPQFSSDGRSVAFSKGDSVKRLDLASGAMQTLYELRGGNFGLPFAWSREGIILASSQNGIRRVSGSSGGPKAATRLAAGEVMHLFPNFLPDQRHFLFYVLGANANDVYAGTLDDPDFRKRLLQGTGPAKYSPAGFLLFARDDVLLAQPFDTGKLELSGEPWPLAEQVGGVNIGRPVNGLAYSVSETGSLAWRLGASVRTMELTWLDRGGRKLEMAGEPGEIANPVLAPDGRRVLITIRDPGTRTRDIWILDLARGVHSRLTFDPADDFNPVWSPDGAYVVFSSNRKGHKDVYRKRADGTGGDEELLASDDEKNVESISPDGKYVLYNVTTPGKVLSLSRLPLAGERKPVPIAGGRYAASFGQFSPDSRWIAYMSSESGRPQVFVQSVAGSGVPAGKWQVSIAGGTMPQWRRDGKELFFLAGNKLMAVPVKIDGATFDSGTPVGLFDVRPGVSLRNHFTASADGQRFLFAWPRDSDTAGQIHVLLNWPALLKNTKGSAAQ